MFTWLKAWWHVRQICRRLHSNDWDSEMSAVEELGRLGAPRAIKPLIKALRHVNCAVGTKAAKHLAKFGDQRAVRPLIRALRAWDAVSCQVAVTALGELGDRRAVKPVIKLLRRSGNQFTRERAAEALGKLGDPRAVEPLIKALGDRYLDVRQAAIRALGQLGDIRAVAPLVEVQRAGERELPAMAANALAMLGAPAVAPLVKALGGGDQDAGQAAAEVLTLRGELKWKSPEAGDRGEPGHLAASGDLMAVELLINAVADRHYRDLRAAVRALGVSGGASAIEPLICLLLRHGSDYVREAAAWTLGCLKDRRGVEPLIKVLGNGKDVVRHAAVKVLGELGDSRAVESLVTVLGDGDSKLRQAVAEALAEFGDARAFQPLIEALGSGDVRPVVALGKLGDARAVEPLVRALASQSADVRLAAALSLARLGETKWQSLIKGETDDFTRLGELGDGRLLDLLILQLHAKERHNRAAAAKGLVGFARANPACMMQRWSEIARLVKAPHTDSSPHTDYCETHCGYKDHADSKSPHADNGIGVDFPLEPSEGTAGKTDS